MKIVYFILLSFFITSCSSKHYKELSTEKYKNINIPKDYTAIYCSCDKNPLLLKIIQELPDRYRLVFTLYVLDDYSHKEIAEMLGISDGTSKSNLARARGILKNKIDT